MTSADGRTADVLLAVRGPHEERLAQEFASARGNVRIARRCADLAELIAAATAGIGTVALICSEQQGFDREVVAELRDHHVSTIALVPDIDGWQTGRMHALGVHGVCQIDESTDKLQALLTAPVREQENSTSADPNGDPRAEPGSHHADLLRATRDTDSDDDGVAGLPKRGCVVAVWGPGGAPGRTSLAINLATELAASPAAWPRTSRDAPATAAGTEVLLVDADTHNPSLAQHLAMLDESAGLALAARSAGQGRLDLIRLAELTPRLDKHLRVLSGIGRPVRWPEAPSSSLDIVWDRARELADFTIVDAGADMESDEALTYDTRAPQRNGATLSALAAADLVIIVGAADPVGIQRLVRALAEHDEAGLGLRAERMVVVNRVRSSVTGAHPQATLRDALARYAGVEVDVLIPDDPQGFDAAILAGQTLAEAQPHSPARRVIAELSEQVRRTASLTAVSG